MEETPPPAIGGRPSVSRARSPASASLVLRETRRNRGTTTLASPAAAGVCPFPLDSRAGATPDIFRRSVMPFIAGRH